MHFPRWYDRRVRLYTAISTIEDIEDGEQEGNLGSEKARQYLPNSKTRKRFFVVIIILLLLFGGLIAARARHRHDDNHTDFQRGGCHDPPRRREWRQLHKHEQLEYIAAVLCLMNQPSIIDANTSHYDDFAFTHVTTGSSSHYAAAFLAWHRLFIHYYEVSLRDKCAYRGYLPYWDWTLDSTALEDSPIWDPVFGFGGNGAADGALMLNNGSCVTDGPFAYTQRPFIGSLSLQHETHSFEYGPHCLSRGFRSDELVGTIHSLISPATVEETLTKPTYEAFFEAFETGPHNAIPMFIRGDFYTFTAPNDPVFWLHHTQVDRLWWLWQYRNPEARLKDFQGPRNDFREGGGGTSSLHDTLDMGKLGPPATVLELMDTTKGLLCYHY